MAAGKVTILSRAEWLRLPSTVKQSKEAEMFNRQAETPTSTAEEKLLKPWWQIRQGANNMKEARGCVPEFNEAVMRKHMDSENAALIELRRRNQKRAEEEDRMYEEKMESKRRKAVRQEQEKMSQRKLQIRATAENHIRQMKEREMLKAAEKLQDKKDAEMLRALDEQHAAEQRLLAEKTAESKKTNFKNRREDIYRKNIQREREAQIQRTEEEKVKLLEIEKERQLLQKKTDQAQKFRKSQTGKQIVMENLTAMKKEKATTTALREEQSAAKAVAKREAELAKQQQEKVEKRAAMLQSISAHRQMKIQKREQKENEERQSNADWLQAQKDADRQFVANEKLKAQKIREDKVKLHQFNVALAAEKRGGLQEHIRDERHAAVRTARQSAVRQKQMQQCVHHDLHDAAEKLPLHEERRRLQVSNKESNMEIMGLPCLPPIAKAVKRASAASDTLFPFSVEGSNYLSADARVPLPRYSSAKPLKPLQQDPNEPARKYEKTSMVNLQQISFSFAKLPPIGRTVKRSKNM